MTIESPLKLKYLLTKSDTTTRNDARNDTFKVKSSSMLQDCWERGGEVGGITWDLG